MGVQWRPLGGGASKAFSLVFEDAMERSQYALGSIDSYKMAYQKDTKEGFVVDQDLSYDDLASMTYRQAGIVLVRSIDDLPAPVDNIITIGVGQNNWQFIGEIDLGANTLDIIGPCTVKGFSQESTHIYGNPSGQFMIRCFGTVALDRFYMTVPAGKTGIYVDGDGPRAAVDWNYMNFFGDGLAVHTKNISNATFNTIGWFGTGCVKVEGGIESLVIVNSLISITSGTGKVGVMAEETSVFSRRLRVQNSAVVITPGNIGFYMLPGNFPEPESCRLGDLNFSGGGTYLSGIDHLDDATRISECRGIKNSKRIGSMSFFGTALTEVTKDTPVPLNIPTSSNPNNQRFLHEPNKLTYTSAFQTGFFGIFSISISAENQNRQIEFKVFKNGVIIDDSVQILTTISGSRPQPLSGQFFTEMEQGDYLQVVVENLSNGTSIEVLSFVFTVFEI